MQARKDAPGTAVIPAKAGIQYSVASRFHRQRSGILDHPPSDDDVWIWSSRVL